MGRYRQNATHQFCDTDLCMVVDTVTGEANRFGEGHNSIGTLSDALDYLEQHAGSGWDDRTVIVKMQCVKGFEL